MGLIHLIQVLFHLVQCAYRRTALFRSQMEQNLLVSLLTPVFTLLRHVNMAANELTNKAKYAVCEFVSPLQSLASGLRCCCFQG